MNSVRSARKKLSLTITDAAMHSGLSIVHWKKIERGLVDPTNEEIKKISNTLGVSSDNLIRDSLHQQKKIVGEGYVTQEENSVYVLEPVTSQNSHQINVVDLFCGAGGQGPQLTGGALRLRLPLRDLPPQLWHPPPHLQAARGGPPVDGQAGAM